MRITSNPPGFARGAHINGPGEVSGTFTGNDKDLIAAYNDMTTNLIKVLFEEASLR